MIGKKFLVAATAPAVIVGALAFSAGTAVAATTSLSATLSGTNEVGGGDPTATGSVTVTVNTTSGQVCATVKSDIVGAVAMHIHQAAAGVNGAVVVPLDATKINAGASCATATAALAAQIAANPAGFYFNVHTPGFPGGAIRGQLAAQVSSVAAGSGGQAGTDNSGINPGLVILIVAGAGMIGAATWRLARH
jgi:CHRD domain